MRAIVVSLCLVLILGCSTLTEVAKSSVKSAVGLDTPAGLEADVGAAVQLGKVNTNTKVSTKDKRLVTVSNETKADNINQSWSTPWWALLIAVLAGVLVDPLSMYQRYRSIRRSP